MRELVRMEFVSGVPKRGFKGHYSMDYTVRDVTDTFGTVMHSEYIFKASKIFKGKGYKIGDIIEMTCDTSDNKLRYPRDMRLYEKASE